MSVQDVEPFAPGGGGEPGNLVWQGPKVIYLYLLGFWFVYIYIYIVLLSFCPSVPPVTLSFWFHSIIFPFHIQHNYLHIFFSSTLYHTQCI